MKKFKPALIPHAFVRKVEQRQTDSERIRSKAEQRVDTRALIARTRDLIEHKREI